MKRVLITCFLLFCIIQFQLNAVLAWGPAKQTSTTSFSAPMYVACGLGNPPCAGSGNCSCTIDPYKCRTGTCTSGSSSICVTNQGPCPTATPTPAPPPPTATPGSTPSTTVNCTNACNQFGYVVHPTDIPPNCTEAGVDVNFDGVEDCCCHNPNLPPETPNPPPPPPPPLT